MKKKFFWNFFEWRWCPDQRETSVQSVLEILFYLAVFVIGSVLFMRWNTVSVRKLSIQLECLKDTSTATGYHTPAAHITCYYPMTRTKLRYRDEFISTERSSEDISIKRWDEQSFQSQHPDTSLYWRFALNRCISHDGLYSFPIEAYSTLASNTPWMASRQGEIRNALFRWEDTKELDSLVSEFKRVWPDTIDYKYREPLIYFRVQRSTGWALYHSFTGFGKQRFHTDYNQELGTSTGLLYHNSEGRDSCLVSEQYVSGSCINLYYGSRIKSGIWDTSKWYTYEDISQAYFDISLRTVTLDSVCLKIDFLGATEFSEMEPMPDRTTMSSIEFTDPMKILQIRADGLRFYARFLELENMQSIRVFAVTAVMSGLVTIFLAFLFFSIFKLGRHIREFRQEGKMRNDNAAPNT